MGLHGLIDFNLHIPANAAFFAFVAGIFFHPGSADRGGERRVMPDDTKPLATPAPPPAQVGSQPALDARNPFAN
jgi:hypothetical protein